MNIKKSLRYLIAALGLCTCLLTITTFGSSPSEQCKDSAINNSIVSINTNAGSISVELFHDAAPASVAELLARTSESEGENTGYYNDLVFDYTLANIEIRTSRQTHDDVLTATTIDAQALGLHEQNIESVGEAMTLMQRELLPMHRQHLNGQSLTPQLKAWLQSWYKSYRPDFLVGTSRQEINEALGFQYNTTLKSRPVTKGAVMLVPHSKTQASPALSIALQDLPERTGKWMVVGNVVEGLDVARAISIAPLEQPRYVKPDGYQPKSPIVIKSMTKDCR